MNEVDRLEIFGKNVPFIVNTKLKALRLNPGGIKILMPFEPNTNHIGIMYAGALFTLAECTGGAVFTVYFKREGIFPIVKSLNITYKLPARTDVTCEYVMDPAESSRILADLEQNGKANFNVRLDLKNAEGNVVAIAEGVYQIRKGSSL